MFHVNVAGVFATIQAFYPLLKVCYYILSVWHPRFPAPHHFTTQTFCA